MRSANASAAASLRTIPKFSTGGKAQMAVNITPLHDRVLVRRLEEKETVKGGIIIPDSAREKPQEGEVVAVGAGRMEKGTRIPLDVKPGDKILFGKYSGNDIKIDDEEFMIMKEDEILAKIGGQAKAAGGKK
jgi:chaperonin GroES